MFKFYVKGQFLGRKDSTFVVADSADYLTATISFSSDWDGYEKIVYFTNSALTVPYQIALDANNEIKKDKHLNLTEGQWEIYVHGQFGTSEITTNSIYIEVTRFGIENGEPFPIKPQTFGQWVKEKLDWFIGIIINTGDGTEFLSNDGTYKPVSGAGSEDVWYPTVSTDGIITWQKSVSTEVPTEQNIKGNQGLKGDTGVQGIQGIQGEKGDTGEIGPAGTTAANEINLNDAGNYFVTDNVESAFQEVGEKLLDFVLDNTSTGTVTKELISGKTIKISTPLTSLTLTLPSANTWHDAYAINVCTAALTIPNGLVWDGGTAPTLSSAKWYLVTIFDGVAFISQGAIK